MSTVGQQPTRHKDKELSTLLPTTLRTFYYLPRISDIASWRWVLEDLTKRLTDAAEALLYEHKALRVVIDRVQKQIDVHSRDASQPGALSPLSDSVEEAILEVIYILA